MTEPSESALLSDGVSMMLNLAGLMLTFTLGWYSETPVDDTRWPEELPDFIREGLQESSDQRKPLFVDFYTEWCGPCKLMNRKVFPDPRVQRELQNWVVLHIDRDRYPLLAKHFAVSGLPTFYLISDKGRVLDKTLGYLLVQDLVEWLSETRRKANPSTMGK